MLGRIDYNAFGFKFQIKEAQVGIFELIGIIAATIAMSRLAETDRGEGFKWGAITFGLCILSLFIPLPFLRILLACGIAFGMMTFGKKTFY